MTGLPDASRRLLIISPRFVPKSGADMQRVRMSLPYYREFGWEPTVLCVDAESSDGVDDPELLATIPADIEIVRARAWSERLCRSLGFGLLEFRALLPLYRAGNAILARRKYDVVFFSTTAFAVFALGPLWRRKFGCRIVYDFQDPWYVGRHIPYTRANAPGGWTKYRAMQAIARFAERFALSAADHIVTVSPGYARELCARYGFLKPEMFTVLPFPAAPRDYEILQSARPAHPPTRKPGAVTWVSVGRAGPDMNVTLSRFFEAVAKLRERDPGFVAGLRIEFIGTNYAPPHRTAELVAPIAARLNLSGIVRENPARISYLDALRAYRDSDAVLVFGSNSPDYTPSKLFNCALAGKPVLAMLRADSMAAGLARNLSNVRLATFEAASPDKAFSQALQEGFGWLRSTRADAAAVEHELAPWTAEALTRGQCRIFDLICSQPAAAAGNQR